MRRTPRMIWHQLRVVGFILLALGIVVFAIIKLGMAAKLFTPRYTLVSFVRNAAGLRPGSQVTVAGQLAGSIESIDFLPVDADTTRNLRVTVKIDESLADQIRADSRVTLRNQGLLGDRMFDITPGTPSARKLRNGDTIPLGPGVDYEQVIQRASAVLGDVVVLTHDLRTVTTNIMAGRGTLGQLLTNQGLYDQLNGTLARTNTLLTRLQNPNGSIGQLLDDPALYLQLTRMVAQVDTLVTQMHSGTGSLAKLLRDDTLYTNLVRVTTHADSLVSRISGGDGTAAKLFTDDRLYEELVKSVTHLNELLADIRRDPKRYTKGAIRLF